MCVAVFITEELLVPERWKQKNRPDISSKSLEGIYLWICLPKSSSSKILGCQDGDPDLAKDSLDGVASGDLPCCSGFIQPGVCGTVWEGTSILCQVLGHNQYSATPDKLV